MTYTPTRAEVEALVARLQKSSADKQWMANNGYAFDTILDGQHSNPNARDDVDDAKLSDAAADTLTALLPLAYTETGETWWQQNKLTLIQLRQANSRAEAAERRLAEVEAELKLLRENASHV